MEVHGLVANGEWVFLGKAEMTQREAAEWLEKLAKATFKDENPSYFSVGMAVFETRKFLGIKVE